MALPPPADLGPYQPVRMLASGAQSSVWLADSTHGELAVKVPRTEEGVEALKREIALFEKLDLPGLVPLVDHDPDARWMAMERIDGSPIDQWASGQSDQAIVEIARSLVEILQGLHAQGVVHGDLKPDNVLVTPQGKVYLLDLGIASLTDEARSGFRGTLGYAAPEVLQGEPATERSDLYGLGALLYRCLAQRDPFESNDPSALAYLPMVTLPLPPSTWRPGLPFDLEETVLKLLSRDPAKRPPDARAVETELQVIDEEPAHWVIGMEEQRDELARAVVRAADGETQVVCVYGTPGSGRRTLITEATQAARRLGMAAVELQDLDDTFFKKALSGAQPVLIVARGRQRRAVEVARALLKAKAAALMLFHSERPIPSLGDRAGHLSPPPLGPVDVSRLARHMRVDPALAEQAWLTWAGHPGAVLGALRRALPHYDPSDTEHLSSEALQILEHLEDKGPIDVHDLAERFRIDPHTLLDHCAVLLAEDRVVAEQGMISLVGASHG